MSESESAGESKCLLHCCCGPCASHCCTVLVDQGRRPVLFFSNSNIYPFEEYKRRWESLKRLALHMGLEAVCDFYDHDAWREFVKGHELDPEGGARCRLCFEFNMSRARKYADIRNLQFTTSLTVSPHKDSKVIFEVGKKLGGFLPIDFKKRNGFRHSVELSEQFGLYRQNYCGCEFSLEERQAREREKG